MTFSFFAIVVCSAGVFCSAAGALRVQLLLCLFGAAAAITLPALGGAVITPAVLFLPFLVLRAWFEQRRRGYFRRVPAAGVWLAALAGWGLLGAICMPRLFAGELEIMTVDRGAQTGVALLPLQPVSGNVTQAGYALGSAAAFLAIRSLLARPGRLDVFRDAVLLLAGLNCAAALLEIAQFRLGLPALLDHVRTAYSVYETYQFPGIALQRIQGTFPETSTFSAFSLPLFAFTVSLWIDGVRRTYSGAFAALLLVLLLLSTSSTAYVGLALYLALLGAIWSWRSYVRRALPRRTLQLALLASLLLAGSALLLQTESGAGIASLLEATVLRKLDSTSGVERLAWNRQAFANFVDTHGLGVGLGSARASSFALVLLSNVGAIGAVLFAGFVAAVLRRSQRSSAAHPEPVREAARQAVLAALAAAVVSWGVFDLGIAFYAFAAAASVDGEPEAARAFAWPSGAEPLRSPS
jgi:hypothetical protein